jgi:hypothetical protein
VPPDLVGDCRTLKNSRIELHLPKFRIGSSALALRPVLQAMGMRSAFAQGQGSIPWKR